MKLRFLSCKVTKWCVMAEARLISDLADLVVKPSHANLQPRFHSLTGSEIQNQCAVDACLAVVVIT